MRTLALVLIALAAAGCRRPSSQPAMHFVQAKSALREGKTHSRSGKAAATIHFINLTAKPLQLFWLDYQGKRQPYGTLPPGKEVAQKTFLTHAWLVAKANGAGAAIYRPDGPDSTVLINSLATPKGAAANVRSRKGAATTLRFINPTKKPVNLYWVDYQGKREPRGQIAPRSEINQPTFAGHAWVVANEAGEEQAMFIARSHPQAAVVTSEAVAPRP